MVDQQGKRREGPREARGSRFGWSAGVVVAVAALAVVACSTRTSALSALGTECNFDEQCAAVPGREVVCVCTPEGGTKPQCATRLAAGDECTRRTTSYAIPCATGLGCAEAGGGTQRCMATVGSGADCTNAPCAEGLFCAANVCAASRGTGEACTADTANACVSGAICGADGVCVTPRAPGMACQANGECSEQNCVPVAGADAGVCAYPTAPAALRVCKR